MVVLQFATLIYQTVSNKFRGTILDICPRNALDRDQIGKASDWNSELTIWGYLQGARDLCELTNNWVL